MAGVCLALTFFIAAPTQAQLSQRPAQVDSQENIGILREAMAAHYRALSLDSPDGDSGVPTCEAEMIRRWPQYQNESRWLFLEEECKRHRESMRAQYQRVRSDQLGRKRFEETRKAEAAARAEQDRSSAQALADLKSGKREPVNCSEYMVTQGKSGDTSSTAAMFPALVPPQGESFFIGNAQDISGSDIVLVARPLGLYQGLHRVPDNTLLKIDAKSKVFRGDLIRTGSVVTGMAVQIGTRRVTLVNGSSASIAIMRASCIQPG